MRMESNEITGRVHNQGTRFCTTVPNNHKYLLMKLHYPLLVAVATLSATASINGVNSTTPSDTNPLDRKLSGNNQQIRSGNNRVVKTHEGDKYSDEGNSSDEERGGLDKIAKERLVG
ncbi:Hypothetical protein PHPALM_19974 [Phytophthora palmivora]|uniref:RxLR effector protein n=1 Tax=Phytophthora palmivora TaxID=4796 RepID=A0A2P4XG14_9STRA|nr:Hypothetical protein PHPALM_19974 [Phytophthora palmivora]